MVRTPRCRLSDDGTGTTGSAFEFMHWNYRIMRHKAEQPAFHEIYYELHEVFYDEQGKPDGWSMNHKCPFGETPEELIECLEMMLNDAKKCKDDILDYE